jgi:hypothetical protein
MAGSSFMFMTTQKPCPICMCFSQKDAGVNLGIGSRENVQKKPIPVVEYRCLKMLEDVRRW